MLNDASLRFESESRSVDTGLGDSREDDPKWHVLWTRSNCEQLVHEQLRGKGFETFLPKLDHWPRRRNGQRNPRVPMFPGYLFIRHAMDKESYIEVSRARGLVQILGERWDRLGTVPEREIEAIRKALEADMPAMAHPYLKEGQRVRITEGPLTGAEGILLRVNSKKGQLVLSVELLKRSMAVEIDCTTVAPA